MKLMGYTQSVIVGSDEKSRYFVSYMWECENEKKMLRNQAALAEQGWLVIMKPLCNYLTAQREIAKFGEHYSIALFFADPGATKLAMVGEGVAVMKQYVHGKLMLKISQLDPCRRPKLGISDQGPYCEM